jgi:pyridoxal phosphate enzyme (YggS family)
MSTDEMITRNLRHVRQRIADACARTGRNPSEVSLVAVTKYAQLDWVRALVRQGEIELGESRPQQLVKRAAELAGPVHWQLIGSLQRNKVRLVLPVVSRIHSVDSVRLLESIDRIAAELELRPRLLLEVRFSGEEAKHGFEPEALRHCWGEVLSFRHVQVEGLMTMAAYSADPEAARPAFSGLRQLRNDLQLNASDTVNLSHLSMGMSGDFETAIEEGATLVRVGSALWEGLGS